MTIYDYVFRGSELKDHETALVSPTEIVSYGELKAKVEQLYNWLSEMENKKILILLKNSIEFIVSFFAITQAGHIAIMADPALDQEINYIIEKCNVDFVFGEEESRSKWVLPHSVDYICKHDIFKKTETKGKNLIINEDEICTILCTSGVTGKPKLVANSHNTLKEALKNYTSTVKFEKQQKILAVTPFFHSYCFGSCMLAGLYSRCALFIFENFNPKIEIFQGVPFMYEQLIEHYRSDKYSFSSLRFCISAGGPLSDEIINRFYKLSGEIIHQEYGSTETGTISINLSNDLKTNISSVGKALNGVEVVLKNIDGLEKFFIKSKGRAVGYYNSEIFINEWHDTGDTGFFKEGFIYITGRTSRLIEISGKKIDPHEIESLLSHHPAIKDVLVKKISNEHGSSVAAYIVSDDEITYQDIYSYCDKKIAVYKIPKIIKRVEGFEKTKLGKKIYGKEM